MKNTSKFKRKTTIIILTFSIISLVLFSSIAYSAFESTMNITGLAHTRVETDVRITDFSLNASSNNSESTFEEFSKNSISSGVKLPSNSSITYEIEITNYGTTNVGIYDITGLPDNLTYSLSNYTLKDKLCDDSGKCNTLAKKIFYITIINSTAEEIQEPLILNFDFQPYHTITYINITNDNYPTEILSGETLQVDLSSNPPVLLTVRKNNTKTDYTYVDNILTVTNITSDIEIEGAYTTTFNYSYNGTSQIFTVPNNGIYKIELWGASGGNLTYASGYSGGKGGYVSGNIHLKRNNKMYVYVGENYNGYKLAKSFNGGGNGTTSTSERSDGSNGGGATDIRLIDGSWDNFDSLKSRIIIASGGGGMVTWGYDYWENDGTSSGGAGGGLIGYGGSYKYNSTHDSLTNSTGGTQTSGGNLPNNVDDGTIISNVIRYKGKFGKGGYGINIDGTIQYSYVYISGGGGGYYGGGAGGSASMIVGSAAGGSSFISGHEGCNAIAESSTESNIIHTGQSVHYSGYTFTDTIMIDGAGYNWTTEKGSYTGMPSHDGTSTMPGNTGNGYAKITLLEIN